MQKENKDKGAAFDIDLLATEEIMNDGLGNKSRTHIVAKPEDAKQEMSKEEWALEKQRMKAQKQL